MSKTLVIEWQRLLDEQQKTCPRCSATEREVEEAAGRLELELAPHGIVVTLRKTAIGQEDFRRDALQSNRIMIAGKTLEEWLGAATGRSACCETCGEAECRTIEYAGQIHEAVPSGLIVKAGLAAAAARYQVTTAAPETKSDQVKKRSRCGCGS